MVNTSHKHCCSVTCSLLVLWFLRLASSSMATKSLKSICQRQRHTHTMYYPSDGNPLLAQTEPCGTETLQLHRLLEVPFSCTGYSLFRIAPVDHLGQRVALFCH